MGKYSPPPAINAFLSSVHCAPYHQPGVVRPNVVSDQQWGFWDFMATAVSQYCHVLCALFVYTVVKILHVLWVVEASALTGSDTSSLLSMQADIAGIPLDSLPINDGYSLVPTLQGNTQTQPKLVHTTIILCSVLTEGIYIARYNYHEYCNPNEDPKGWGQAVRFMNWKAVR